jgi:signal transduction histidine kinase
MTYEHIALLFNILAAWISTAVHAWLVWQYHRQTARRRVIGTTAALTAVSLIFAATYTDIAINESHYLFLAQNVLRSAVGVSLVIVSVTSVLVYQYHRDSIAAARQAYEAEIRDAERETTIQRMMAARSERERVLSNLQRQIINNVGHELRTPVTIIIGYIEMLLAGDFGDYPPPFEPPFNSIHANTKRINIIVKRMLVFLRDVEPEPFDLYDLVYSIASSEEVWIATRKAPGAVTITCDGSGVVIEADRDKTKTAVFELIHNALKFSPDGETVSVTVTDDGDAAVVRVQDHGVGIAKKDNQKIFEPFVQVNMETTRPFEGTGMGLTVVKSVAESHGGYVEVGSEAGNGAVFTMVIPK